MKRLISIVTLLVTFICSYAQVERYSLKVGEFSSLKVEDNINVDYRCVADSVGMAVFDSDARAASLIGFSNDKGCLKISYTNKEQAMGVALPTVTVYSSFLTGAENVSDSTVRVMSASACPTFTARQVGNGHLVVRDLKATRVNASLNTGNGQVILYGQCDEANLKLTGTGMIQADALEAQVVKCRAFGTGAIGCNPVKELRISGMGSTTVYYRGNPEIHNRAAGVKLEKLR